MKKDVLLSISGLQIEVLEEEGVQSEPIEVITPASYFFKGGKHYIIYEEITEGLPGVTKNKIKIIGEESLEIMKSGIVNAHMIFEKNKNNLTYYETPYGQILMGIHTTELSVQMEEDSMDVKVEYELDLNHEPLANCKIRMNIRSKDLAGFTMKENMEN
ncbi:MAG: DUF1934 domain-containing protein [Lachnospiraceae bacterium]